MSKTPVPVYELSGTMWIGRRAIIKAIQATGCNYTNGRAMTEHTTLIVGQAEMHTDGTAKRMTSKMRKARELGCKVVHEFDARKLLEKHPKARIELGLPAATTKAAQPPGLSMHQKLKAAAKEKAALESLQSALIEAEDAFGDL